MPPSQTTSRLILLTDILVNMTMQFNNEVFSLSVCSLSLNSIGASRLNLQQNEA